MRAKPDRRSFLASMGAVSGLALLDGSVPIASATSVSSKWDMSWLDRLAGKHKQVFDVANMDMLRVVPNYLDSFEEVYQLRHPDVNTVVGIHGRSFPINANDATWAAWKLGERYQVKDPDTGVWAVRNIYYDKPPTGTRPADTVKALQARGTIFWMCNNALNRIVRSYSEESKRPFEDVRNELIAGLHPGVILVPAHTMLLGLCQERGCSYQLI
jgi:hypothetical protein